MALTTGGMLASSTQCDALPVLPLRFKSRQPCHPTHICETSLPAREASVGASPLTQTSLFPPVAGIAKQNRIPDFPQLVHTCTEQNSTQLSRLCRADFERGVRLQQAPTIPGVLKLHDTGHPQVPCPSQLGRIRQVLYTPTFLPATQTTLNVIQKIVRSLLPGRPSQQLHR